MKLLTIPIVIPFPLDNGGAVAQYAVLEYLQDKCQITVCCNVYSIFDIRNVELLRNKLPKVRFEIIDLIDEKSNKLIEKTSHKWLLKIEVIKYLKRIYLIFKRQIIEANYNLMFLDERADEFKDMYRINPVVLKSESFINQLSTIIKSDNWDIIQPEFYEMLELVNLFPTNSKKVFISHESRTLRLESAKKFSALSDTFCDYIISINKLYETQFLKTYDSVIVFSDDDKTRLNSLGVSKVEVSAFPILTSDIIDVSLFKKLKQLVFIGGASHYPNREGFIWFIENIYPSIYEKYRLPLVVIGNWDEDCKIKTETGEIIYKGFVENISEFITDSIQIVPVRIGNGIRTKILLGMAMKMPIIATSLGVEGIQVKDYKEILIADTVVEYMEKIEFILFNEKRIQNIIENACNYVKNNYSQEVVGETRLSIYKRLLT